MTDQQEQHVKVPVARLDRLERYLLASSGDLRIYRIVSRYYGTLHRIYDDIESAARAFPDATEIVLVAKALDCRQVTLDAISYVPEPDRPTPEAE